MKCMIPMAGVLLGMLGAGVPLGMLGAGLLSTLEEGPIGSEPMTTVEAQRIDLATTVNASIDDVWHAWTTDEGIQTFLSRNSNVKLGIGGPFEILFLADAPKGSQGSEGCKILSYLPKEMLSFSWNAPPKFDHARGHYTWVVVRFEKLGDKRVRVKLTHLGWAEMKAEYPEHASEWDAVYDYFTNAWASVLDNLKKRFDEGPRWG